MTYPYDSAQVSWLAEWAAQECEWQQSGEHSVARLIDATLDARRMQTGIDLELILHLGKTVEPVANRDGLRNVDVRVGDSVKMSHWSVPHALYMLIEYGDELTPTEWFREYEEIHPFRDGNGRTGSILWNILEGNLGQWISLLALKYPPNLWDDPRRNI